MESSKWEVCIQSHLAAPLQRVWETASDFYAVEKWFPGLEVCQRVEGAPENGPGCVRFVSSSPDKNLWAKEKLTSFDSINHSYAYAVIDTNIDGFQGYEATFQVSEGEEKGHCLVSWNFQFDHVGGLSQQGFEGQWRSLYTLAINALGDAASSS